MSAVHLTLSWATLVLLVALFASRRGWVPRLEPLLRPSLNACLVVQVVVSLALHLRYSPYTAGVRANVEVVLHDSTLRYWNVVHPLLGLIALVIALWSVNRRPSETPTRADTAALALAVVLTAAALPSLVPGI
jgi:hypothetical protein